MLLITLNYDSPTEIGPPFSVAEHEIRDNYSQYFKINLLEKIKTENIPPKFAGIEVVQSIYWLERI